MCAAQYDGLADWYDSYLGPQRAYVEPLIRELLGPGAGRCLDLGCGGGAYIPVLAALGWRVVGVDVSADQLRVARERTGDVAEELVQADATDLPFEAESFDAVLAAGVTTDIEPWEGLVAEGARVLRPGGRFVSVGLHPCFVGPHVFRESEGRRLLGTGYRERERKFDHPSYSPTGLRAKVGAVHVPLDDLLNAVLAAGMRIDRLLESREGSPPVFLGLVARA